MPAKRGKGRARPVVKICPRCGSQEIKPVHPVPLGRRSFALTRNYFCENCSYMRSIVLETRTPERFVRPKGGLERILKESEPSKTDKFAILFVIVMWVTLLYVGMFSDYAASAAAFAFMLVIAIGAAFIIAYLSFVERGKPEAKKAAQARPADS